MAIYLGNAFSLQMLNLQSTQQVQVTPIAVEEVKDAEFVSVVGHADTATVLTAVLGKEVSFNRASVRLEDGDVLYVAQVTGGRLPEGATQLPEGFALTFVKVTLA